MSAPGLPDFQTWPGKMRRDPEARHIARFIARHIANHAAILLEGLDLKHQGLAI